MDSAGSRRGAEEQSVPAAGEPAWHSMDVAAVERELATRPTGLAEPEVAARRARFGENALPEAPPTSRAALLARQLRSPLIYILLVATAITVALGDVVDAAVIAVVVTFNTAIGFAQERRAELSVRALMKLVAPRARVVRDGRAEEVASRNLVPGDVVVLESGARVPGDLRLTSATRLAVDESLLTGESVPVAKRVAAVPAHALVADRDDIAHMGTIVSSGRGRGYVVATGLRSELGRIAEEIRAEPPTRTPLEQRIGRLAKVITAVVVIAAICGFGLGIALGESAGDMFLLAVALAVSAVPEGLPVVVTITLAVGVRRMARRNAILRRLPAVETLGSTTIIGSDKTGTLTQNRMTVDALWSSGRAAAPAEVEAPSLVPGGDPLQAMLLAGVLTNEAELARGGDTAAARGDPTEVALLAAAGAAGLDYRRARGEYRSVAEIPFEPERRYSASVRERGGRRYVFVKGAPERVLAMCDRALTAAGQVALDRDLVRRAADRIAAGGRRVLATAFAEDPPPLTAEEGGPSTLIFLGLIGMLDPPRPGVREAIAGCRSAGIRVVMVTGDHAATARAIGTALGLAGDRDGTLTGAELAVMDDDELDRCVREVAIYARVAPEHKLRIVHAFRRAGEVVAVTGDGVNDAPALKAADIGVAMGRGGTDVAREAADMVLTDDNFVSIYSAVEEGRVTFDNIRKVTFFLISSGAAEIVTILAALALGWPLVFLPAQLLWLNLVTNGFVDVALAFEPGDRDVLARPPRSPREGIVSPLLWQRTALTGAVMAAGTLLLFRWELTASGSVADARTIALTTMVLFQIFHVGNARSERRSAFGKSPLSNRFLLVAAGVSLGVHVAAIYLPPTEAVLRLEPVLDWQAWVRMIAVASTVVAVIEIDKLLRGRLPGARRRRTIRP